MNRFEVSPDREDERVDVVLAEVAGASRSRAREWLLEKLVTVNGEFSKPSRRVQAGDVLEWTAPPSREARVVPIPGELTVLHEDADILVLDKPADLVVHPGAGTGDRPTLVHHLLARYPELESVGGAGRPGIVHRLDRDTTGVLVVARNERAYQTLSAAFAARQVTKHYVAVTYGAPANEEGSIERPIGRHPRRRKEMAVREDGRAAHTGYRVLASGAGMAVLELDLHTGRTHQIRVHLKSIGHPLVGDPTYGENRHRSLAPEAARAARAFRRPALHARTLAFEHPREQKLREFSAPVPQDLVDLWVAASGQPWPTTEPDGA